MMHVITIHAGIKVNHVNINIAKQILHCHADQTTLL